MAGFTIEGEEGAPASGYIKRPQPSGPIYDDQYQNLLGAGDIANISLARDPNAQLNYISKKLNVGLDQLDFLDGIPVQISQQGDQYSLYPKWKESPFKRLAGLAGDVPVMVGSIAAQSAPVPLSPIVKSQLGAAGGEQVRQELAEGILEEDLTGGEKLKYHAFEQGMNLGGEYLGKGVGKFFGRNAPMPMVKTLSEKSLKKYDALVKKANDLGIDFLSIGEATQLRQFQSLEKFLQRHPMASEAIDEVLEIRNDQVEKAVFDYIEMLSPKGAHLEEAGQQIADAASDSIKGALKELQNKADPFYSKAFKSGAKVNVRPILNLIQRAKRDAPRTGTTEQKLDKLYNMLTWVKGTGKKRYPARSVRKIHAVKLELDRMLNQVDSVNPDSLSKDQKIDFLAIKRELVKQLKNASPDYEIARGMYEYGMPEITQLDSGIIRRLAETQPEQLTGVAKRIFDAGTSDPAIINRVKNVIQAQNPEAWNALIGARLREVWMSRKEQITMRDWLKAGKFRQEIFGSPQRRRMWEAALEPEQFDALKDMMEVFEATGKVFANQESFTVFGQLVDKMLRSASRSLGTTAFRVLSPFTIGKDTAQWIEEHGMEQMTKHLAEIITSPNAAEQMKNIRLHGPKNVRGIIAAFKILGVPYVRSVGNPLLAPERRDDIPQMQPTTPKDLTGWKEGAVNIPTPNLFGGSN